MHEPPVNNPWIVTTERLALREMNDGDLDFVAAMLADPDVMRYYPRCYNREEARGWIARQRQRYQFHGFGLWLVIEQQTGVPVGQIGLLLQDVDNVFQPEVGYLLHRPYWHKGYATEAARGVLKYARQVKHFDRVISLIRPENTPSRAVAARLGAKVEKQVDFKGLAHLLHVHAP